MEKLKNKYVQWIGAIIFALSGAVLSLQLILDTSYTTEKIIITKQHVFHLNFDKNF